METIEYNKMIAEFMGLKKTRIARGIPDMHYRHKFCTHGFYSTQHENSLLFHSSWDWLMPVVEKIETELDEEYRIVILENECSIFRKTIDKKLQIIFECIVEKQETSKIYAVWLAIIEFIKLHNNKPKE